MTDSQTTANLLNSLRVKQEKTDEFIGLSADLGWGRLFGGRLIAQALSAAQQSCTADVVVHSLHCYFLRLGNVNKSIRYQVERLREGISHQSWRVLAKQGDHDIFHLTASFHKPIAGLKHQDQMPTVIAPENLKNDSEILRQYVATLPERYRRRLPQIINDRILEKQPLELRPEHPLNFLTDKSGSPERRIWMRFKKTDTEAISDHNLLLAYASDFSFLGTSLQPHHLNTLNPRVSMASINHVIWFHQASDMGAWNLFSARSCQANGGKALVQGEWFNRSGQLIASCAQEGIVRYRGAK